MPRTSEERANLVTAFATEINKRSAENVSDTPDFMLGEYLVTCLEAYESCVNERDEKYPRRPQNLVLEDR